MWGLGLPLASMEVDGLAAAKCSQTRAVFATLRHSKPWVSKANDTMDSIWGSSSTTSARGGMIVLPEGGCEPQFLVLRQS